MSERYFFRLIGRDEIIEDPTGIVVESIHHAQAEMYAAMDELRRAGELPDVSDDWRLEIYDAAGRLLRTIRVG